MQTTPAPSTLLENLSNLPPERGGVRAGERLVVALSGGADSTAMLDLLHRLAAEKELELIAAHLDHGLRPESADDAKWCAEFCEQRGIEFITQRVEIPDSEDAKQLGVEAAARDARYRFLDHIRESRGFDLVATAHHLDDHIETLLLWLFRGTGLTGMEGIRARTTTRLRPLREATREDILVYVKARELEWREDSTNAELSAQRNRIRHELLPQLRESFGPDGPQRLVEFAEHAARAGRFIAELAETAREGLQSPGADEAIHLDRKGFGGLPEMVQLELLRRIVRDLEPPGPQRWDQAGLRRLREFALTGSTGKRHPLAGGGWLGLERGILAFEGPRASKSTPPSPPELSIEVLPASADLLTITPAASTLIDADKVMGDLQLRLFEPGDRMQLAGMDGRKKLSELYREHGIPAHRRASMWVVADGEGIVWTAGVATSGRCRITPGTRRVLRLTLSPPL